MAGGSTANPPGPQYAFGPWKISPTEVFFSTQLSFAFVNLRPLVPGHVLVSPKRVAARFSELSVEEVTDMWTAAHTVGQKLEPFYGADSMTYAIQDGPAAGQTVPHVHIHILPRKLGDFERNDQVYDAIEDNEKAIDDALREGPAAAGSEGTDKPGAPPGGRGEKLNLDVERKDRTSEEMAQEARALSRLFL